MCRAPLNNRPIIFWLAIGLAQLIKGEEAGKAKEAQLMNAARIKRHGSLRITVGVLLIIGGLLQLSALIV